MNEKDFDRLKRQIEEKCRADLEALNRVRELSQSSTPREISAHPEGLPEKVKQAVQDMGDKAVFTKRTLTNHLRNADPTIPQSIQNAVGGILKRMKEAGEINLVRVGKGKRATEYARVNGQPPAPLSLDE